MKCPRCGNEVSLEEAFCGQCGTSIAAPQALPTEMVHTPPPQSGRLNSSYPNSGNVGTQNAYGVPPSINGASFPASASLPHLPQQPIPSSASSQSTGFYRDATEAMSVVPSNPNGGYQQPLYPMTPPSGAYPPQGAPVGYGFPGQPPLGQPLHPGNFAGQAYPQPPVPAGQGYRNVPLAPQKQRNGAVIFIVSICLVITLLSVVGLGTLYILKGRNAAPKDTQTQGPASTVTTVPTATSEVPTATIAPTATTAPTPTAVPTATPDPGFAYCGQLCAANGFSTQYPQGWSAVPLTGVQGVQFVNPSAPDQTAIFKALGATASSPTDLVANDLQQNFAGKNGYTVVTPAATDSIGGETWFKEVITYQGATQQKELVEVYANVHQGKAYILELQASQDQFATATTPAFATIKIRFQFQ